MKSIRCNTRFAALVMVAGAALLGACREAQADKKVPNEQRELATPDQTAPDQAAPTSYSERAPDSPATTAANDATPRVSCRRVTASSIPVFTTTTGSTVACSFFQGDTFSYFGVVTTGSISRLITWCPRGVPPAQGFTAYAQIAGTVDGGCG